MNHKKPLKSLGGMALLPLLIAANSHGVQFQLGEVQGSLNSQATLGGSWRMEDRDPALIGTVNGGTKQSSNYDDGNLNYDSGDAISLQLKGSHDLELQWRNYGAFFRGRYWYDWALEDGDFPHREVPDESVDRFGSRVELLDAFVYADWFVGEKPLTVRAGKQVINWGESLFIGGINSVQNPIDVFAFRSPGSEIKEGILPTNKLYLNFGASPNITLEGYVDFDWMRTEIDGCGMYWSSADFAGRGCNYAYATTGVHAVDSPPPNVFQAIQAYSAANAALVPPTVDGGLSANNAGLALQNVLLQTSQVTGIANPLDPRNQVFLPYAPRQADELPDDDKYQHGLSMRWFVPALNNTEFGFYYVNYHSKLPYLSPVARTEVLIPSVNITPVAGLPGSYQVLPASSGYNFVYPDDIDLYGLSFATTVESGWLQGLAIAGEWSLRPDMPLQQSLPVFLNRALFATTNPLTGQIFRPFADSNSYSEHEYHQAQVSFLYNWPSAMGADQLILAAEMGMVYVASLEEYNGNPILENPANPTSLRDPNDTDSLGLNVSGMNDVYASQTSWGYRVRAAATYNNVFAGVNLRPQIAWRHDVKGYAPGPGAPFTAGNQSLGLSLTGSYLEKYNLTLGYTMFLGDDKSPLLNEQIHQNSDKDFLSLSFTVNY